MALPININDLLSGAPVEWERLEFKEAWNPLAVLHTLCAFANDFHNLGGGYIVMGVAERDGHPVLPPVGLSAGEVEMIQKEVLNLGHSAIQPQYHPIIVPELVEGKRVLVLWAPGGQTRPYKARLGLGTDAKDWGYFIRKGSSTVGAKGADEQELLLLAATVPFDDRINQRARIEDLSRPLIVDFLVEVESDLAKPARKMPMAKLGRQMNIVGGPKEAPFPVNVGLLFFNPEPHRFFPATQIDVVWFPEGAGGDKFTEKTFRGPIHRMLREALDFIQRNYITETVIKHPDRAEATRVMNFPYAVPSRRRWPTRCIIVATRSANRSKCASRPRTWSCSAIRDRIVRCAWRNCAPGGRCPGAIATVASVSSSRNCKSPRDVPPAFRRSWRR